MAVAMENAIVPVDTAGAQKERDLREAIQRRRATLRESLKLKPSEGEGEHHVSGVGSTETSFTNTKSLLESLKESRLKRKGQLPPLEQTPSIPTVGAETADSASVPDQGTRLRERLRQRKLKKQGDSRGSDGSLTTSVELEPPPQRKLRGLRDLPRMTRFDETLPDEQLTAFPSEGEGIEHINRRKRRALYQTTTMEEVKQKTEHVLDQDAYDFFTSEIENYSFPELPSRLATQTPVDRVEESGEPEETEQDTSDTVALREQLLQQIQSEQEEAEVTAEEDAPMIKEQSSDDYRDLLLPGYARYTPYRVRLAREENAFFTPSTVPVSAEQKTPDSGPPHYAEEEGLYVGERPHVLWTNQVAMENRLLRREDKGAGWFGEDGLLLVQPNPLSPIHTRPSVLQYNPQQSVSFKHAKHEVKNQKLINKGSGGGEYELEVEVSSLLFHHHPLFSVEHLLASKLKQTCRLLRKQRQTKTADYYQEKLQGLRQAVIDLKQALQNEEGGQESRSLLLAYLREMRTVREKKREALAVDYDLLKAILKTWHDLKALRDNQGYSSTTAWITVKRLLTSAVDEEASLRREVDDQVCELRDLHELESRERTEDYQRELADWKVYEKTRRRAVREAARLQQQSQEQATDDPDQLVEGSRTSLNDLMASVPPERPRPMPPPAFDEGQLRAELLDYYRHYHKPPGEPILTPEFSHNHALSQEVPRVEQHRREDTVRAKIYVRVLFNNKLVSQTKECTLNSDFSCEIKERFTLKIVQWPESIKLEIFESGLISSTLISEVYVPIPDPLLIAENVTAHEAYQFSSTRKVEYGHTAVGSGQPHPVLPEEGVLLTSGVVKVRAYWGIDETGRSLCPPGLSQPAGLSSDAISSLGVTGIADLQEVKRWIEHSRLDPNDPRNAELLHLLESVPSSSEETSYFRLVDVDQALRFVGDGESEENRRFAVLRSRQDGHPGLKNKSVPIDSKWISESEWRAVTNYKPYADYEIPLLLFGDFHSVRKAEQNKFLLDIRERVLSKARSGKEDLTLDDVVHAFSVPDISSMRKVIVDLFSPQRPLNPVRATRRKPKRLNAHVSNARIVVRVVRALNVPTRTSQQSASVLPHPLSSLTPRLTLPTAPQPSESSVTTSRPPGTLPPGLELADPTFSPQELKIVCPYVEVGFRGSDVRTATAYGPQPFWNEEISLPFEPPDKDFSPAALQKITDVLHVSLFDEVVTDILQDDRQRRTNIHHRIEKKWLGSFTLPFSTLHQRERIEGVFRVEVPAVLLGYSREVDQVLETSSHTHLQLFVTLEPTLSILPPLKDKFESEEHPRLLSRSQSWVRKLKERFPKRNYIATALDVGGHHVFVTRFVKAQNPPAELTPPQGHSLTLPDMERLARYVSLIPFLPDTLAFSGECDIWNTSDQFLHMLAGDEEEHALLLCNYFLHCGLEAWVVMGHAIPEGSTSYVLTYHPEFTDERVRKHLLWNPNTGHHYRHDEPYSPLKSVGCVFNQHNVWANVQEQDEPAKIHYDLSNSKQWQALFPPDMPPLDSVQQELDYSETDSGRVRELQEKLERVIHDHITSLRERFITRWNRHCSQLLRALLLRLEEDPSSTSPHNELDEITASYKLTGFPIHSPYVDAQHLVATIERTGLHLCEDPKVEFALAVYVHSFPNDVVSIWIYVASLIPN